MKYLISYVWNSTRRNHAGIAHMCDLLNQNWPDEYRVIKYYQEPIINFWPKRLLNIYTSKLIASILNVRTTMMVHRMLRRIKDGDCVCLLEYVHPELDIMRPLIAKVNLLGRSVKFYGMAHFTPSFMQSQFGMNSAILTGWSEKIDKFLTLGTSLSEYFIDLGIPRSKVATLFHYVDLQYYRPYQKKEKQNYQVIIQGNLQRNFELVETIVSRCPSVQFSLLCGRLSLPQFEKYRNVTLWNYISEDKLKEEMNNSDVSLSVMDDTVGSNVIVTSMAMGLAMIVSDVGSIHDYCDDSNAIFCKSAEDFCEAITALSKDSTRLNNMKKASLKKSYCLSIEKFHEALNKCMV